jgi:hypothetical protein
MMADDDLRALAYLGGYREIDKRGVPRKKSLKENSSDESDCRKALLRVLRSPAPLDREIREMLANMFDPDPGEFAIRADRKLSISFRAKSRPRDDYANTHIAWFIWEKVKSGARVESAIRDAIGKFNISRERAYDLWGPYRRTFERIWGPLP